VPTGENRRATDVLRAVDGLLQIHLQGTAVGARPLANLAVVMAIDYSGAKWGALLLDEGDGEGPTVSLLLGKELAEASSVRVLDRSLIADATERGLIVQKADCIAAPILTDRRVRGILYLHGVTEEALRLASAIASRIGTLLRSGELVEELSRRTEDVGLLENLGAALSAGRVTSEHLARALEGAVRATRSRDGLLVLFQPSGAVSELQCLGPRDANLWELGGSVAEAIAGGSEKEALHLLGEGALFRPLRLDLVNDLSNAPAPGAVGFLAVRGAPAPYGRSDRSFFNAVGHLLDGALARVDYFKRAAEDPLTATGSRLALHLKLGEAQAAVLRTGEEFSVVLVDLDHFKEVNDAHGHLAGDQVLREIAQLLTSRLRSEDSVARYGGDEFLIILPRTGPEAAERLAEELRVLTAARRFGEAGLRVSLSMGVATCRPNDCDLEQILQRADDALYASKTAGRNQVSVAKD
jgi:diguanylate cyclase (GGDEF)-like protein